MSFLIIPLLFTSVIFFRINILRDSTYYSGSFAEYLRLSAMNVFLIAPLLFLIFILWPYNVIVRVFNIRTFPLYQKYILFFIILCLAAFIVGTFFVNLLLPGFTIYLKYLLAFATLTILFVTPLHFLLDKKPN